MNILIAHNRSAAAGFFSRQGNGSLWCIVALFIAVCVSIPVLVVTSSVFVPTGEVWNHLATTVLPRYMANSALLVVGVGVGTFVVGVGTAWLVTMYRFPGCSVFEWALILPFAVPAYVLAYTYTGIFEFAGPVQTMMREVFGWSRHDYWFPEVRSLGGAIWMMTFVLYPYVYLLSRAAFIEQSVCVIEVSRTLGCGRLESFVSVGLPLARPAIVAGMTFALIETLNDFGTVQYFAVDTLTTGIFRTWIGLGQPVAAAQLAAILMTFVFAVILLERWTRGNRKVHHTSTRHQMLPRFKLPVAMALGASLICFLPIVFGFLLPGSALVVWSIETAGEMLNADFMTYAFNSFLLAAVTAFLAVLIGLFLAYGQRLRPGLIMTTAIRISSLGYAIPGAVIAVGVLIVYTSVDRTTDGWFKEVFGFSTGLLLTGTIAGVVIAYLVRFLAISLSTADAGLAKITPNMDAAARTLGHAPGTVLLRVHAPLMWGSVLTAAMLVFVDVMKELPATIILRPFNFDTLAIRAYQLASDERLADSSNSALAIVLVGIIPVIALSIAIARSRPGHEND
ncbi:iron ABC transporter permease [Alphaproteobacteria bacterium]|nr:iron ABC transporter permease [Alphaproteobacteria bacterium]